MSPAGLLARGNPSARLERSPSAPAPFGPTRLRRAPHPPATVGQGGRDLRPAVSHRALLAHKTFHPRCSPVEATSFAIRTEILPALPPSFPPPQSPSRDTGRTISVSEPVTLAMQVARLAKLARHFSRVARTRKDPCSRFLGHTAGSRRSRFGEDPILFKPWPAW